MEQLINLVVAAVVSVLGSAFSRQITDEFKAWTPWLIDRLMRHAVSKLPENERERRLEEWRSHIDYTPGEVGKIWEALSLLRAPSRMPNVVVTVEPSETPTHPVITEQIAFPPLVDISSVLAQRRINRSHLVKRRQRELSKATMDIIRMNQQRGAAMLARGSALYAVNQGVLPEETPLVLREQTG